MRRVLDLLRAAARPAPARDRLRLGRLGRIRGARLRRHASPASRCRSEQLDLRPRAHRRRRARPTAASCELQDYRDIAAAVRRHRLDRDVRGRRARVLAGLLRHRARAASSPAAAPASRPSLIATTCSSATAAVTDFIQQYIFPGGLLPSPPRFREAAARAGLEGDVNELDFGLDYAETLRRWRAALPRRRATPCARSVSTSASCASGSSIWPTARPAFAPDRSMSCSSALNTRLETPRCAAACLLRGACRAARQPAAAPDPSSDAVGSGTMRFFGLHIYDTRLWCARRRCGRPASRSRWSWSTRAASTAPPSPNARSRRCARQRPGPSATLARWEQDDARAISRRRQAGDRLTGVRRPAPARRSFSGSRSSARSGDEAFADAFFGIWLSPRRQPAAPDLRAQLLKSPSSPLPRAGACWPTAASACRWPSSRCRCMSCSRRYYSGVPLAVLGALLLGAALSRRRRRSPDRRAVRPLSPSAHAGCALPAVCSGWAGSAFLPCPQSAASGAWLVAMLALTTSATASPPWSHQPGARGCRACRTNAPGWSPGARASPGRRGAGHRAAVVLAPTLAEGLARMGWIFFGLLLGFAALTLVATPRDAARLHAPGFAHMLRPLANPAFARFVAGYLLNGVAARCRPRWCCSSSATCCSSPPQPLFLVIYFLRGALGLPLWVRLASASARSTPGCWHGAGDRRLRLGVLAGCGDLAGYRAVCVATGLALGADLALPRALVADMIDADATAAARRVLRLVNFFAKLNLALAAGLALPLLDSGLCARRRRQPVRADADLRPAAPRHEAGRAGLVLARPPNSPLWSRPMLKKSLAVLVYRARPRRLRGVRPRLRDQTPVLDLATYFNGPLTAWGYFTDRSGKVKRRFTVKMTGTWQGNEGVLDRDSTVATAEKAQRIWRLTQARRARYIGRADDVMGEADGRGRRQRAAMEATPCCCRWTARPTRCSSTTGCT